MSLAIDSFSAEELRALDAIEQIGALNDLFGEVKRLANAKEHEIDRHADAKIALLGNPKDREMKAAVIDAKRRIDKIAAVQAARKQQIQILQSLLRSIPA